MGTQFQKLRTNQVRGQEVHHYAGLPGGKKQFQKLRTNQVRGQSVLHYGDGLPSRQTVPEAHGQSGEGLLGTLSWWSHRD